MRTLTLDKKNYAVPGDWNELTSEQLVFLALILRKQSTAQEVKLKLLLFVLNARIRRYNQAKGEAFAVSIQRDTYYLSPEQFAALASVFDFLFSEAENGQVQLDIQLTRNPWPLYLSKSMALAGPDDALTNISYGQFIMLQSWQQQMKHDYGGSLDNFLSVIWKDSVFTTSEDGAAVWLRDVDPNVKTVMFWYYLGSMRFIQAKFPRAFPESEGSECGDIFDGQMRLVDEMASGDVTKKELVKSSLLYDALYTLEMALEREAERAKKN